jgi:hypothetical protein
VRPGIDGLRTWADAGQVVPWHERHNAAKCSMVHYPGQTALRGDLQLWDGEPSEHLNDLRRQIDGIVKASSSTVDWRDPNTWIAERLNGPAQGLAQRLWSAGAHPRYISQPWRVAQAQGLLDDGPTIVLTGDGRQLIEQPAGDVAARVDEDEGVLPTLGWIDERGPISTTDLLEPWASWLEEVGRSRNG